MHDVHSGADKGRGEISAQEGQDLPCHDGRVNQKNWLCGENGISRGEGGLI